jgi:hypothetical protein
VEVEVELEIDVEVGVEELEGTVVVVATGVSSDVFHSILQSEVGNKLDQRTEATRSQQRPRGCPSLRLEALSSLPSPMMARKSMQA